MSDATDGLVEHFFRHESANLVAVLTRIFGFELIDTVEDMVQEALAEALASWRIQGVPANPVGWLHRVARNRIVDTIRRDQRKRSWKPDEEYQIESAVRAFGAEPDEVSDSLLRMMFACCDPCLDRISQLALTLKIVCGFSDVEVSRGLLMTAVAIKKRVTRSKRTLQRRRASLEYPAVGELPERLSSVHEVLYLMFNEGYSTAGNDSPIRSDLCEEAARLCHLMCTNEIGNGTTMALLSLMLFHASRLESRVDASGVVILLADQDRSKWDRKMIQVADYWLAKSAGEGEVSRYHLEAAIARLHCQAGSVKDTDWSRIAQLYGLLDQRHPSAVYRLNKAIAIHQLGDMETASAMLRELDESAELRNYPLLHCFAAKLYEEAGEPESAKTRLRQANACSDAGHEQRWIESRLSCLGN